MLSQLQELCIAMQTIPLEPEARLGSKYVGRRLRVIGSTENLTAGKPYRWIEKRNGNDSATRNLVSVSGRKTRTSSSSKITIESGPHMTAFKVSGNYGYKRWSEMKR